MQNMTCVLALAVLLPLCARAAVMMDIAGGSERVSAVSCWHYH